MPNNDDFEELMRKAMASEMDELNGGVTCNTIPSRDGQNHFRLLFKSTANS